MKNWPWPTWSSHRAASRREPCQATSLTAPVDDHSIRDQSISDNCCRGRKRGRKAASIILWAHWPRAKGLGYLLEAAELVRERIELTLIGHRVSAEMPRQAMLEGYRWIPSLSHADLLEEMARHDVLRAPLTE